MKKQLHAITTENLGSSHLIRIAKEIQSYIDFLHLRKKEMSAKQLYEIVVELEQNGFPLGKIIINDRLDVALVSHVGGVQLASHSLPVSEVKRMFPKLRVGCSVHSFNEAIQAERGGADFLLYGHIFPTSSKRGIPPRGVGELREMAKRLKTPIIAIGGIQPDNAWIPLEAGAAGIAVMSGIFGQQDPRKAAKRYQEQIQNWGERE